MCWLVGRRRNTCVINAVGKSVEVILCDSRNDSIVNIDMDEVRARALAHPLVRDDDYKRHLFIESRRVRAPC